MGSDVRRAPTMAVFALHPQRVRGTCCWCGGVVTERTLERGWLKYWHDSCQIEYLICSQPAIARKHVRARDNGICADCGAPPRKEVREWNGLALQWSYETETWHVDHKIPLWKVAGLPDLQRLEYFKLQNLITRCEPCHALKTGGEAAERAHIKRLINPPERKGRKLEGRGMSKPPEGYKYSWRTGRMEKTG